MRWREEAGSHHRKRRSGGFRDGGSGGKRILEDPDVGLSLYRVLSTLLNWLARLVSAHLPYILPYILRHPQAEAEGMALVRKCLLMES